MGKEIVIAGERLILLPEKAVFWPDQQVLLISDLHLGKIIHFRKAGIGLPVSASEDNYIQLQDLIQEWLPKRVIFLGDLFHSVKNSEWTLFCDFIGQMDDIVFELVIGNHDILDNELYLNAGMVVYREGLNLGPFYLSHHPEKKEGYYNLCGHLHPGVRLKGKARQSVRLACFLIRDTHLILPAFGTFTGMHIITPKKRDNLYAIVNSEIVKIAQ